MRLYLDANAFIYAVEGPAPVREQVLEWIDRCEDSPDGLAVTSELSRMEARVKPMQLKDLETLARFDRVFDALNLSLVPLSSSIVDAATRIRAQYGFRAPDALHLATAVQERTDVFLTSDSRLRRFTEVKVALLSIGPVSG